MKYRMLNVFMRVLKNEYLAVFFAWFGYKIFMIIYCVYRPFLRGRCNINIETARHCLNCTSSKPQMNYEVNNKEKSKDLSIIIPAYNASSTIKDCINSIISQKTKYDYEVIIINDGSTDSTKEIVENIFDEHLLFINQENRGFSGARNRGIDESVGKYIMFVDADDRLVGNSIEIMMEKIESEDADIVQGSYFSFVGEISNRQDTLFKSRVMEKNTSEIVKNPGFPWAKIYKAELFEKIRFPRNVWFEDTIVCMLLYRMCNKMAVMKDMVYAYRINPDGITKKARYSKKCVDHYWVMEHVLEKSKELNLEHDEIEYRLIRGHMSTLLYRRISLMDEKVKKSAFVLACEMLDKIRPKNFQQNEDNFVLRDIERAFQTRNYKLWKIASFIV